MRYRWKPNAAQKAAYKEKMQERESIRTIQSNGAIRTGCEVEYYSITHGCTISGTVIKHSYGSERNQHTFTVQDVRGDKHLVKGRNLYSNLINHKQGKESYETR